jgi:hypothetical protein
VPPQPGCWRYMCERTSGRGLSWTVCRDHLRWGESASPSAPGSAEGPVPKLLVLLAPASRSCSEVRRGAKDEVHPARRDNEDWVCEKEWSSGDIATRWYNSQHVWSPGSHSLSADVLSFDSLKTVVIVKPGLMALGSGQDLRGPRPRCMDTPDDPSVMLVCRTTNRR